MRKRESMEERNELILEVEGRACIASLCHTAQWLALSR